jgi:hypothetical protein
LPAGATATLVVVGVVCATVVLDTTVVLETTVVGADVAEANVSVASCVSLDEQLARRITEMNTAAHCERVLKRRIGKD